VKKQANVVSASLDNKRRKTTVKSHSFQTRSNNIRKHPMKIVTKLKMKKAAKARIRGAKVLILKDLWASKLLTKITI